MNVLTHEVLPVPEVIEQFDDAAAVLAAFRLPAMEVIELEVELIVL